MSKYYVWRRNDGHIGATCYPPSNYHNPITNPGVFVTYEIVAECSEWQDVYDIIKANQGEKHEDPSS